MGRHRIRRGFAAAICLSLVAACSGQGTDTSGSNTTSSDTTSSATPGSTSTTTSAPPTTTGESSTVPATAPATTFAPLPIVVAPPPPSPAVLVGSTPAAQAIELDGLVSDAARGPLAGWLAVYDLLSVPVLDGNGVGIGTTGDDPVGPPLDMVWMLSDAATRPGGMPLTDLVRLYIDDDAPSEALADALLGDLRAAVASADPQVAVFGNFVRERALRSGARSDLLLPDVTAADVHLDGGTALLVSWVAIRNMTALAATVVDDPQGFVRPAPAQRPAVAAPAAASTPCSQVWGDETSTFWVNFFSNKIGSGLQLPGMENATKGLIDKLSELNPAVISKSGAERFGKISKVSNLVGSVLSLVLAVSSLDVEINADPMPFERNKKQSQGRGKTTTITWVVKLDIGSLPDGDMKALCAMTFLLNTVGIGFSFPVDGALPGVEVQFEGRTGFGQGLDTSGAFVYLDANELRQTTDASGSARTVVTGKEQPRDFPDSAQPWMREFSIHAKAQIEGTNGNTLANIFFDGLSFGITPDFFNLASGAGNIARTLRWSLGEHVFVITDWRAGWKIDQNTAGYHFTGVVCDTTKPFTVDGASTLAGLGGAGTFTIVPDADQHTAWTFVGSTGLGTYDATGTGSVSSPTEGDVIVTIGSSSDWVMHVPQVGDAPLGEHIPSVDLTLVPLETNECTGG